MIAPIYIPSWPICIEKSLNEAVAGMVRAECGSVSSLKPIRRSKFIDSLLNSVDIVVLC